MSREKIRPWQHDTNCCGKRHTFGLNEQGRLYFLNHPKKFYEKPDENVLQALGMTNRCLGFLKAWKQRFHNNLLWRSGDWRFLSPEDRYDDEKLSKGAWFPRWFWQVAGELEVRNLPLRGTMAKHPSELLGVYTLKRRYGLYAAHRILETLRTSLPLLGTYSWHVRLSVDFGKPGMLLTRMSTDSSNARTILRLRIPPSWGTTALRSRRFRILDGPDRGPFAIVEVRSGNARTGTVLALEIWRSSSLDTRSYGRLCFVELKMREGKVMSRRGVRAAKLDAELHDASVGYDPLTRESIKSALCGDTKALLRAKVLDSEEGDKEVMS